MSNRSPDALDARELQMVTGARYTSCLQWVRYLNQRYGAVYLSQYMQMIAGYDIWMPGDPVRCFLCMRARHGQCKGEPSDLFGMG